jgi:general secretion pathway protein J
MPGACLSRSGPGRSRGFTLVELMVALFALSLLAIMSWRGIDGMTRAQQMTATRADEVLTLQIGLAQWSNDLDALQQLPRMSALDWNGRVLRMTRRGTPWPPGTPGIAGQAGTSPGIVVVAWTRRDTDGIGTWLRWQSPPATTRAQVEEAWQRADVWSQSPGADERRLEVAVVPLADWQLFYYRGDAWTNPLSSDAPGVTAPPTADQSGQPGAPGLQAAAVLPDGVRLVLTLPPGNAITGVISRDWARPTVAGGKS